MLSRKATTAWAYVVGVQRWQESLDPTQPAWKPEEVPYLVIWRRSLEPDWRLVAEARLATGTLSSSISKCAGSRMGSPSSMSNRFRAPWTARALRG